MSKPVTFNIEEFLQVVGDFIVAARRRHCNEPALDEIVGQEMR